MCNHNSTESMTSSSETESPAKLPQRLLARAKQHKGKYSCGLINCSLLVSHASSQYVETHPTPDVVDEPLAEYADETESEILSSPTAVEPERPPLNRAVQVDALLENWRTQIRKAGIETEEIFLEAINDIFETEK